MRCEVHVAGEVHRPRWEQSFIATVSGAIELWLWRQEELLAKGSLEARSLWTFIGHRAAWI